MFRRRLAAAGTALLLATCLQACGRSTVPASPCGRGRTNQVDVSQEERVDLLFVIDDSPSMAEEQAALRKQLPELVSVLATGDLEFGRDEPGAGRCGFEQPLEAMLKALMPGDASCTQPFCTFFEGTRGHADDPRTNGGFLRPDALLGVVILTEVREVLPPDGPLCEELSGRSLVGMETDESGLAHPVCRVQQLPAIDGEVPTGDGWFYDDSSADTRFHCSPSRPRRVAFTPGARPPPDAIVRLRCLFPVYAEPPGHGAVEPMHRACDPYPSWRAWPPSCGSMAPEGFASPMICDPGERTCAAPCDRDDDCGAGLFCDGARADRRDLGHLDIRPLNGGECPAPSCRADWDCPGTDLCVKGHCSAARGPRVTEWVRDDDEGICFRCVLPYRPVVEDGAPTCAIPCSADADCQHPDVAGTVTSPDGGTRPVGPTCLPSGYCLTVGLLRPPPNLRRSEMPPLTGPSPPGRLRAGH